MFTTKREGRFRRKSTMQARRRPRAFRRRAAASTTSRWGWLKAQRAAFVSFILTNETALDVEMLTAGLPLRSSRRYHVESCGVWDDLPPGILRRTCSRRRLSLDRPAHREGLRCYRLGAQLN